MPLLTLCVLFVSSSLTSAATRTWVNFGSGDFTVASNWFEPTVPTVNDFVSFEVGSGNPYVVTIPGSLVNPIANYSTSHLRVRDNGVTFAGSTQAGRSPSTYTVASPTLTEVNRGIIIGVYGGETASLNVSHFGIVCCGRIASLNTGAATLGDIEGANGTLNMNTGEFNVTGDDALADHELIVGNHGTGTLNVNNGADVNVSGFVGVTSVGNHATGVGTVNVSGAGSTWYNEWKMYVGFEGSGTFTVQNGGSYVGSITEIGAWSDAATGTVTVTGSGSTWTNTSGSFYVGATFFDGQGFLNIENGGVMNGSFGHLRRGAAVVTGPGSRWNNSGSVYVGGSYQGGSSDATLNVSDGGVVAVGTDQSGQLIVWGQGTLDGDGTILGNVRSDGFVAPGNSTGILTITGNYTQRDSGYYSVEIFGLNLGTDYDHLNVGGAADLAGVLEVDVADNGYTPMLGDTFEILRAAGGVFGIFDSEDLPAIGQTVRLTTIYGEDNVVLAVVPIQTGDFNGNGIVDAADYTVWRNSLGQTGLALAADGDGNRVVNSADYSVWRSHFGQKPGIGAVPEPTTAVVMVVAFVSFLSARRVGCQKRRSDDAGLVERHQSLITDS